MRRGRGSTSRPRRTTSPKINGEWTMAKAAVGARTISETTADAALAEYAYVRLRHDVTSAGVIYETGSRGVIVHRHADGVGYEVEFEQPAFRVITLTAQDIQPAHG